MFMVDRSARRAISRHQGYQIIGEGGLIKYEATDLQFALIGRKIAEG